MNDASVPVVERPSRLLGLDPAAARAELGRALAALGQPGYRVDQVLSWLYERRATTFEAMTDLPAVLRPVLAERFSLTTAERSFEARSEDGTIKHLWRLEDDEEVESVLIPSEGRVTLCLSSQVGCALGCRFCATGDFGFRRQLDAAEIAGQYRDADLVAEAVYGRRIANVVYMGMGEPFANLDAVLDSLTVLHGGFGLGARRITVSTVGLIPGIAALARRPEPFRLAVSLHAADPELRLALMPVEKRYPLPDLLEAIQAYQATKGRRVSIEYAMIDEVNDAPAQAADLVRALEGLRVFVNLIPWNPVPGRDWRTSPPARIRAFLAVLESAGLRAAVRAPRGRDIAAACGQLRLERSLTEATAG